MKYLALFASILFIGSSLPSQANTLGNAYENCRVLKFHNYDIQHTEDEVQRLQAMLCAVTMRTMLEVAAVNCFEERYRTVLGAYYGYSVEQVIQALINYAEANPADWDNSLVLSMGAIALSNNLECKVG